MSGKSVSDNDKIIHLGDRDYYLSVSMYNDKVNIHLRQYYRCFPERLFPTKIGVTLTEKEYFDILKTGEKVKKFIDGVKVQKKIVIINTHHLQKDQIPTMKTKNYQGKKKHQRKK